MVTGVYQEIAIDLLDTDAATVGLLQTLQDITEGGLGSKAI
jgi:hypothetical protein